MPAPTAARRGRGRDAGPYNPPMIHALQTLLAPALMEKLVLVVNHVLGAEPAATRRMKPHAGRIIRLGMQRWPSLLPAPPELAFRVTPAGLIEWCGGPDAPADADLWLRVDAANPLLLMARGAAGEMPAVDIDGDAQLAGDVNWLLQNLRWDVAADLEGVFGPALAHSMHRLGSMLARALRSALQGAAGVAARAPPP
jgi:ubiquinone biosynthesis protein UbiJ